jgi:Acetyltransferase (GNAT) domain
MPDIFQIQYIKNASLDKERWNQCIQRSANGLVYAYSFYLDAMCPGWDALVLNDYTMVMPLTHQRKWGIAYLYQPFLSAQLGVFGNGITAAHINAFIEKAAAHYRFIEISLNYGNCNGAPANFITERNNYILPLDHPYELICQQYKENTRRNIKKCLQSGARAERGLDADQLISLAVMQMQTQGVVPGQNVERFRRLYQYLLEKQMATTYGIFSADNQLLAAAAFFFSHHRAYYILVGNNPEARNTGASHALIDAFIQDHADKHMLLDFEGSDIPGLAQFYSSFGAINQPYPSIRINRLPFFLKWLKK